MESYDLIIAGGGCAGLSLALELLRQPELQQQRILIIDRAPKNGNDRTWCFWTGTPQKYAHFLQKTWPVIRFTARNGASEKQAVSPYAYAMVRSADFYAYAQREIARHNNINFLYTQVEAITDHGEYAIVQTRGQTLRASWVFNSCLNSSRLLAQAPAGALWQHFRGWWIRTQNPVFQTDTATLMDFRTPQTHGGHFMYVLPLTPFEALVEYTIFSDGLLADSHYDHALKHYLEQELAAGPFEITERESGVIPMFELPDTRPAPKSRIIPVGTVGGAVKPTTGYAFLRIQEQSRLLAKQLAQGLHPCLPDKTTSRFVFYDRLLLHLLQTRRHETARIFEDLFLSNPFPRILKFLDEGTHLAQEAALFSTLPQRLFLSAFWEKYIWKKPRKILSPEASFSLQQNPLP